MVFRTKDRNWNVQNILSVVTISGALALPRPVSILISVIGFSAVLIVFYWQYWISNFKYTVNTNVLKIAHMRSEIEIPYRRMEIRDFELGVVVVNLDSGNEFPILSDMENYPVFRMTLQERIEACRRQHEKFEKVTEDSI